MANTSRVARLIKKGDSTTANGMNVYSYKGRNVSAYRISDVPNRFKFLYPNG